MLDIRRIRHNPEELQTMLQMRGKAANISELLQLDQQYRQMLCIAEEKKSIRNAISKQLSIAKKNGNPEKVSSLLEQLKIITSQIDAADGEISLLSAELDDVCCSLPNFLACDVPAGMKETDHQEKSIWGERRVFPWEPKSGAEIEEDLGLIFPGAEKGKIYSGQGACLKRSVCQLILDSLEGYEEIDFGSDQGFGLFHLYENHIFSACQLPLKRKEIRFAKYSGAWIQFVNACSSTDALHAMLGQAEEIMQQLSLPYRTAYLCAGQTPDFSSATYRIDVWTPSVNQYLPVFFCSDCEAYFSRKMAIRYRDSTKEKPKFVHAVYTHGFDLDRLIASILENFQMEDGSVSVPDALSPFMGITRIRAIPD